MTTETACVGDIDRQGRVRVFGVGVDVTGKAATAAIEYRVQGMGSLVLPEVTACTEFAQHRVGRTVAERLQACVLAGVAVHEPTRDVDHAMTRVHQALANRRNPVGVATTACPGCIAEETRETGHALVRGVCRNGGTIATVTDRAVVRGEFVCSRKPRPFLHVAIVAIVTDCRRRECAS